MQDPNFLKYINTTIKLLSTHSGRDKVAKTLHYASRIWIWHLQNKGKKERADQIESFRQAIGNSRRVGRFFSLLNSIPSIYQLVFPDPRTKDRESDLFRFLLVVANVSDMLYYVSDNLTYAAKYGFIKLSPETNYFWYLLCSRLFCFYWRALIMGLTVQGGACGVVDVVRVDDRVHCPRHQDLPQTPVRTLV